jgi:hypothetical protein
VCETRLPARPLPRVRGWWLQGSVAFLVFFFASAYVPLWLSPWLAPLALLDASALGTLGGGFFALVLAPEQGYYPGASQRVPEMLVDRDVTSTARAPLHLRRSGEVTP